MLGCQSRRQKKSGEWGTNKCVRSPPDHVVLLLFFLAPFPDFWSKRRIRFDMVQERGVDGTEE